MIIGHGKPLKKTLMFRDLFNVALIFGLKIETIYETNSNAHFSGLNSLIVLLFSTIYKCTKNLLATNKLL